MAMPNGPLPTAIVLPLVLVAMVIGVTVPLAFWFVTYAYFPSGVIATPVALDTLDMVAVTVLFDVSMTFTSLEVSQATYTNLPSGVTATPTGIVPMLVVIVVETVLVEVSITETELPLELVMYTYLPFGVTAAPAGPVPTVMVSVTVLVAGSIAETVPALLLVT
jgi:hypothetical protein